MIAEVITAISAGNPGLTSMEITITPSAAPPAGLTNTAVQLILRNGSFTTGLLTTSPDVCAWTTATPFVCTVVGLTASTGYQFQARFVSTEAVSASTSPASTVAFTLLPATLSTPTLANPTQNSIEATVTPSAAPPSGFTNPRIEFYVAETMPSPATRLTTSAPCVWPTTTAAVRCTVTGLSGGTGYRLQARLATDQAAGSLSTASSQS